MEKKRQKIWTAIGVGIAIALLLYWLTLAIWIDDDTDPPMPPPGFDNKTHLYCKKFLSGAILVYFNNSIFLLREEA